MIQHEKSQKLAILQKSENPNTSQRQKLLRFQKGLLMIQNKASLQKFHIMAQAESRMTLQKALALWK